MLHMVVGNYKAIITIKISLWCNQKLKEIFSELIHNNLAMQE